MKKLPSLILASLFVFTTQAAVWAEDAPMPTAPTHVLEPAAPTTPAATPTTHELMFLIDQGLERNLSQIQSRSSLLGSEERYLIYDDKKKEPVLGFLLNFLVGLGIGSFVIGDSEGGMTELIGEAAGLGVGIVGSGIGAGLSRSNPAVALPFAILGFGGLIAALVYRIGGWFRPFDYTRDYNAKLQEALSINPAQSSLLPYIENRSDSSGQVYPEAGLSVGVSF